MTDVSKKVFTRDLMKDFTEPLWIRVLTLFSIFDDELLLIITSFMLQVLQLQGKQ